MSLNKNSALEALESVRDKLAQVLRHADFGVDSTWAKKDISWCIGELDPETSSAIKSLASAPVVGSLPTVDEWIALLEKNTSPRLWGADRRQLAEQIEKSLKHLDAPHFIPDAGIEGVIITQDGDGYDPGSCWTCSRCNDARYWEDEGPAEHGVKFCTNCGAKVKEFVPYVAPTEDANPPTQSREEE